MTRPVSARGSRVSIVDTGGDLPNIGQSRPGDLAITRTGLSFTLDWVGTVLSWLPFGGPPGGAGTPVLYTVDNRYATPPTPAGPFPSIADAQTALVGDGYGPGPNGPATILILRGTYVESIDLDPSIRLVSMAQSPEGATIVGNVRFMDPLSVTTRGSISGITIAPTTGDALLFDGTSAKVLTLNSVTLKPVAVGAAGLRVTNTGGGQVVGVTSNLEGDLGLQGDPGALTLVTWQGGTFRGGAFAIQSRGVELLLKDNISHSGPIEVGPRSTEVCDLLCLSAPVTIVSGNGHVWTNLLCWGTLTQAPLTIATGSLRLKGFLDARCIVGNPVVIAGAGTLAGTASLQFRNGDVIAATILTDVLGTAGHFQGHTLVEWTVDPPTNPYPVPGRFERMVVRGTLSAPWTFQLVDANQVPTGQSVIFKNLDPVNTHLVTFPTSTLDGGALLLPAPVPTGNSLSLFASRQFNDWVSS